MKNTYRDRSQNLKLRKRLPKITKSKSKSRGGKHKPNKPSNDPYIDYTDTYSGEDSSNPDVDQLIADDPIDDGYVLEPDTSDEFQVIDEGADIDDPEATIIDYDYPEDTVEVVMSDETEEGYEVEQPVDEFEEYYFDPKPVDENGDPLPPEDPDPAYCCTTEDGCVIIDDPTDYETLLKKFELKCKRSKGNGKGGKSKKVNKVTEEKVTIWCAAGTVEVKKRKKFANFKTLSTGEGKDITIKFDRRENKDKPEVWIARVHANSTCEIRRKKKGPSLPIPPKKARLLRVGRKKSQRIRSVIAYARPKTRTAGGEIDYKKGKRAMAVRRNRRGKIRAVSFMRGDVVILIVGDLQVGGPHGPDREATLGRGKASKKKAASRKRAAAKKKRASAKRAKTRKR